MKFFSRESSEKLAKLGCKSEMDAYFFANHVMHGRNYINEDLPSAFSPYDFLGDTEISKENCRKLWGDGYITSFYSVDIEWEHNRIDMLYADDQIAFIEGFLK